MKPLLALFAMLLTMNSQAASYPPEWWAPVPREGAPEWEILPQDATYPEVILSKRHGLGILSNFAPTPFTLDGETYASVEGFWQMMKYPEGPGDERFGDGSVRWPHTRAEVARMTAFEAAHAGGEAAVIMKRLGIDWVTYRGKKLRYLEKRKGEFYDLIVRAECLKVEQNASVKEILLQTGDLILKPDHHQEADAPPAWRYFDIWMEIRAKLRSGL